MKVPLLDLKSEYSFLKKEIDQNLKECFLTQKWILGPMVSRFEVMAAQYLGLKHAIGVASGTDALIIGLRAIALGLFDRSFFKQKDEIITTPFSFIATAEAITRAGARPVFVDIEPDSFNIDPDKVRKVLTKNSVGLLPVHLYGQACSMAKIKKIAKVNKLFILEDCAQSFGASYGSKKLGSFGDAAAFSFFPSKNLGAFGDGGMVVVKKKRIADLAKILRNHGQTNQYQAGYFGYNSRLDSIQAAVLLAKLKHIDELNQKRIKIASYYEQAFGKISEIKTPAPSAGVLSLGGKHIFHLYTIKVPAKIRDSLARHLNAQGIGARVYYPVGLDRMPIFKQAKVPYSLKNTEAAAKEVLSLPIYPFMGKDKVEFVADRVINFIKRFL